MGCFLNREGAQTMTCKIPVIIFLIKISYSAHTSVGWPSTTCVGNVIYVFEQVCSFPLTNTERSLQYLYPRPSWDYSKKTLQLKILKSDRDIIFVFLEELLTCLEGGMEARGQPSNVSCDVGQHAWCGLVVIGHLETNTFCQLLLRWASCFQNKMNFYSHFSCQAQFWSLACKKHSSFMMVSVYYQDWPWH